MGGDSSRASSLRTLPELIWTAVCIAKEIPRAREAGLGDSQAIGRDEDRNLAGGVCAAGTLTARNLWVSESRQPLASLARAVIRSAQ